jgi:hypothetical protein
MTGSQTLLARTALGVAAAMASVLFTKVRRVQAWPRARFDRTLLALFAASRVGLFAVLFLWAGVAPRGDVPAYYLAQALQVLAHRVPYRDFPSSYAPLHPYLDAALLLLWQTPLALMLFAVLAEVLLLPVWLRVGRAVVPEAEVRTAALLYLASPISLQFVAVDGQDNVVIALLLGVTLLLLLRGRIVLAGATTGLSIAAVKFLPLLYVPAFFLGLRNRWRWAVGAAAVVAVVYAGFAMRQAPILQPLAAEGNLRTAGNLPYLVEAISGFTLPGRVWDLLLLLVLGAILWGLAAAVREAPLCLRMGCICFGMSSLTLAVLLLSKKSWPPYLILSLFPICLVAAEEVERTLRVAVFAVFSMVAVIEHSVWASGLSQISAQGLHAARGAHGALAGLFLLLEAVLIAGYAWLLVESLRRLRATAEAQAAVIVPAPELQQLSR